MSAAPTSSAESGKRLVLVTGATGWLGSTLVRSLVHGIRDCDALGTPDRASQIRCLALPGEDTTGLAALGDRVQLLIGDLRNSSDCGVFCSQAKGALLFHTAGIIHPRRVEDFYSINVNGTGCLLDAATKAGVRRAVVVSSNSPCGCNPHPDHLFDELSPYRPYMKYGRSKMLMELDVNDRFKRGAIETVLIRAPWFYGPNQPARQTLFFRMVRDGKAPIVGSGNNMRSMAYLENLCQGLLLAGQTARAAGQTFWIADEQSYSMNQIVDTIEQLLEQEFGVACAHRRLRLPGIASEVAYLCDAILQATGIYHQKIHVLSEMNKTIACSIRKAKEELGYQPAVSLIEGMRQSLAWCRDQGIAL